MPSSSRLVVFISCLTAVTCVASLALTPHGKLRTEYGFDPEEARSKDRQDFLSLKLLDSNNSGNNIGSCALIPEPPDNSIVAADQYDKKVRECLEATKKHHDHDDDDDHHDHHHHHHQHGSFSHEKRLLHANEETHGHSHETGPWNSLGHKLGALVLMLLVALVGCLIPVLLRGTKRFESAMTYVNSFACGTFFGLAFFHLLPEALYVTKLAQLGIRVGENWYNFVFLLSFFGFVLILLFEKVLLAGAEQEIIVLAHSHGHHSHGHSHNHGHSTECHHLQQYEKDRSLQHHHDTNSPSFSVSAVGEDFLSHQLRQEASTRNNSLCKDNNLQKPTVHFSALTLFSTLSLSVHSVFEGIVVGTFADPLSIWIAAVSICGHKWGAGFALASTCGKVNMSGKGTWLYLIIFIVSSPLGVIMGVFVSASNSTFIGVIDSLSLGAILYTSCELLFDEFGCSKNVVKELIKYMFFIIGAMMIFGLYLLHVYGSPHEHSL